MALPPLPSFELNLVVTLILPKARRGHKRTHSRKVHGW
jgi:hypothetical protein